MKRATKDIITELQAMRALGAELIDCTSRLENQLALVQGPAPTGGKRRKWDPVREAVEKRNKRLDRK